MNYFPYKYYFDDYILITRLKSTADGEGERLHLEGKCSKGREEHIRFSPVCKSLFINKRDPEKVTKELEKYLKIKG